ncbi:MAG: EamA family transporter [Leifsonia sp.]|nr:EamA family transporter [Leifsonia sp.]|tara:strand:+ start:84217 stop:85092 length:876 start_codon:yes stop_codon:yes gene_type:complete
MNRERIAPVASVAGSISVQTGAALGATLFPLIGPLGVVAVRQAVAAAALLAIARPRWSGLTRRQLVPAALLGVVLVVMNLSLYSAVERIGLGLAVTLEFLGPLAVALASSRRKVDGVLALVAGLGVVLLTGSVPGIDLAGVLFGLVAAVAWAAYILLNQRVGARLPGVQGTALASAVAALLTAPVLIGALARVPGEQLLMIVAIGAVVGVLSSAVPYSIDLMVLRVLRRETFAILQSVHPAAGAVAGLIVLGQVLTSAQLLGIALISGSNIVAIVLGRRSIAPAARLAAGA